jgi:hypothetical protein
MIGMGERSDDPPIEELQAVANRLGPDAVHPACETYKLMAGLLDEVMERPVYSYLNSGTTAGSG